MGFRRWKNCIHHLRKGRGKSLDIRYFFLLIYSGCKHFKYVSESIFYVLYLFCFQSFILFCTLRILVLCNKGYSTDLNFRATKNGIWYGIQDTSGSIIAIVRIELRSKGCVTGRAMEIGSFFNQ